MLRAFDTIPWELTQYFDWLDEAIMRVVSKICNILVCKAGRKARPSKSYDWARRLRSTVNEDKSELLRLSLSIIPRSALKQVANDVFHEESMNCARFICQTYPDDVRQLMYEAADWGDIFRLTFMHQAGAPLFPLVLSRAGRSGHFPCVIYAFDNGCPATSETLSDIVTQASPQMLDYFLRHGCKTGERHIEECTLAAEAGRLDNLKVLRKHNASWSSSATLVCVYNKDIDCLRYLHQNGCPWNKFIVARAKRLKRYDILKYAVEHQCHDHAIAREELVRLPPAVRKRLYSEIDREPIVID